MNKRIAKTLLILCIAYMIGYYILKFIFPEKLLLVVTDENIIRLGTIIDSNKIYKLIFNFVTSFITLFLFTLSCCGRFKIKWYEILYIILATILCMFCAEFKPDLYTHTSISIMLILTLLCKGKMGYTVITFTIHGYLSQFLFSIRGFSTIMKYFNSVTGIVLMTEGCVWMIILTLFFNIRERNYERNATISKQND
jgi:hypothetical protein